jgi:hypothetical protein
LVISEVWRVRPLPTTSAATVDETANDNTMPVTATLVINRFFMNILLAFSGYLPVIQ